MSDNIALYYSRYLDGDINLHSIAVCLLTDQPPLTLPLRLPSFPSSPLPSPYPMPGAASTSTRANCEEPICSSRHEAGPADRFLTKNSEGFSWLYGDKNQQCAENEDVTQEYLATLMSSLCFLSVCSPRIFLPCGSPLPFPISSPSSRYPRYLMQPIYGRSGTCILAS